METVTASRCSQAWRADSIDAPASWYFTIPEPCRISLDESIAEFRTKGEPVASLRLSATLVQTHAESLRPALDALERGRGFVIIRGMNPAAYSRDELQAIYWLVGQMLGVPFEQNVQGTLLYDVRDTGQDVKYGARFSVTNAESTFHTDNSFGDDVLDYVGLLCICTAKSGGLNQVVSGYAAYEMLSDFPDVLAILEQPFHVDRRGGVKPGQEATAQFPIFARYDGELLCRYLRYWIEVGHEKAHQPLRPEQVRALDKLDAVLGDPSLRAEFALEPGDMFFINNRWILHNRTRFEDHAELDRRRHYVRLWLKK